jgi:hypothetical protein
MFESELEELQQLSDSAREDADAQRARIHESIRRQARQYPAACRQFVDGLDVRNPDQQLKIWDIYEALSVQAADWESFFLAELDKLLAACATNPRDNRLFKHFVPFGYLQNRASSALCGKFRERFVASMSSPVTPLRRASADMVGSFQLGEDAAAIEATRKALRDPDWKVRTFAEVTLSEHSALPPGYAPSLLDRIRRRLFNWTEYV